MSPDRRSRRGSRTLSAVSIAPTTKEIRLYLDGGNDRGRGQREAEADPPADYRRRRPGPPGGLSRIRPEPASTTILQGRPGPKDAHGVDRKPYTAPRKSPKDLPPRDWGSRWTAST